MKRIALLICSPLLEGQHGYLPGTIYDVMNMRNFLLSTLGGGWVEDEIIVLQNPTAEQVRSIIVKFPSFDFAFLYYSGHGFTDSSTGAPHINLNSVESPSLNEVFIRQCEKQTTVLDCCRGYQKYSNLSGPEPETFSFDRKQSHQARKVFNSYLLRCPKDHTFMWASQVGQNSIDTGNGGYFSLNILRAAEYLAKNTPKSILTVNEVFSRAYSLTKDRHQPVIHSASGLLPFAVNLPEQSSQNVSKPLQKSASTDVGPFLVGAALLAGLFYFITD